MHVLARKAGVIPVIPHKANEKDKPGFFTNPVERPVDSINIMMLTLTPALEMFRGLADEREQFQ
ncbi:hypothetical protein [Mesorhizobium sp. KR2-14]|uniref:hypothetical protein n=1 Tax=Mesorhizobium sp. KR2-14 TaxID=3156610 RepID=UPI0032B3B400